MDVKIFASTIFPAEQEMISLLCLAWIQGQMAMIPGI